MNELYNNLLSHIPDSIIVDDYLVGARWTYVQCAGHIGLAKTINEARFPMEIVPQIGMPLSQLCRAVLSWNYLSAGLGLAAINTAFNNEDYIKSLDSNYSRIEYQALIGRCKGLIENKRAAFIDYPVTVDMPMMRGSKVSILKQQDYPFAATEYILAEQDYIFISGASIINKTLPRLLTLTEGGAVIPAGPDIPAGLLTAANPINECVTFVVTDIDQCIRVIKSGAPDQEVLQTGYFVHAAMNGKREEIS